MSAPAAVVDRILSTAAVCEMLGVGRSTLIRLRREDHFPKAIQLSSQRIGWRSADVSAWLDSRPEA